MSDDAIEQIRRDLSTARMIKRSATDWTDDGGGDRVGRCTHPEHGHTSSSDKGTPNVIVTDDDGWYCYSHSTGGGIFEWIAVEEDICDCDRLPLSDEQFKDALKVGAERAGVDLGGSGTPDDYEEAKEVSSLTDEQKARYALHEAVDILHDNLDTVVDGMSVRRQVKELRPFDDETIDEAKIGYLDLDAHVELTDQLSDQALRDIGFHDEDDNLHAQDFIIYPYFDGDQPVYWTGRRHPANDHPAKYLKPKSGTTVFDQPLYKYRPTGARDDEGLWVVEGIQDCIATAQNGNVHTVSGVATNLSQKQLRELLPLCQEKGRAVVCFDADGGGDGDSLELALDIMSAGVQTEIAKLPEGTDPNDYVMDGGDIGDLPTESAVEVIIERRGDSDPVIEDILDTVAPDTPRGDRVLAALDDLTDLRVPTLRKMMDKEPDRESRQPWREPRMLKKTNGADPSWTIVYHDGTEIQMDNTMTRNAPRVFAEKFAGSFNYFPDITREDWIENLNDWTANLDVVEVDPLTLEGRVREKVQEQIQTSQAVEDKDDLATTGSETLAYHESGDVILVQSDLLESWLEDLEVSHRQARDFLDPLLYSDTTRLTVEGVRRRFWLVDVEAVEQNGYSTPDPRGTPELEGEDSTGVGDL